MRFPRLRLASCLVLGAGGSALASAGCGSELSLFPPAFENRTDTLKIWAASGTAVFRPSAFLISTRSTARVDQLSYFDFMYDITPAGEHVLLPFGAVAPTERRSSGNPGLLPTAIPYDSILIAEQTGYLTVDTLPVRVGDTFFARSRPSPTCFLGIPYYAKLRVIAMNEEDRSLTFMVLANINCGYRSLEPGLPEK